MMSVVFFFLEFGGFQKDTEKPILMYITKTYDRFIWVERGGDSHSFRKPCRIDCSTRTNTG